MREQEKGCSTAVACPVPSLAAKHVLPHPHARMAHGVRAHTRTTCSCRGCCWSSIHRCEGGRLATYARPAAVHGSSSSAGGLHFLTWMRPSFQGDRWSIHGERRCSKQPASTPPLGSGRASSQPSRRHTCHLSTPLKWPTASRTSMSAPCEWLACQSISLAARHVSPHHPWPLVASCPCSHAVH